MKPERIDSLPAMVRALAIRRCKELGLESLLDLGDDEADALSQKAERLARAIGRKGPDEISVEELDRAEAERQEALAVFGRTIPARYRDASIGDFPAAPFIGRLQEGQSGIVVGGNGIGKTRLAWALARGWKAERPSCTVQIVKGAELLSEVKAIDDDWYRYIRDVYGHSEHLFIDEIDKIKGSEADWMLLTYLIDYRYEWMRQTVVLGNCGKDEVMKLLGQSSYSRLSGDGASAYHLVGRDKRQQSTEEEAG